MQDTATANPFKLLKNDGKPTTETIKEDVKEYYGKTIQKTSDLQTGACLLGAKIPTFVREALQEVHDEVTSK